MQLQFEQDLLLITKLVPLDSMNFDLLISGKP